jgi:hypothetical protein
MHEEVGVEGEKRDEAYSVFGKWKHYMSIILFCDKIVRRVQSHSSSASVYSSTNNTFSLTAF